MPNNPTTGVRDPGKPSRWLVPPWQANASVWDIVDHFVRHDPQWDNPSTAALLAYFEAYDRALDAAPLDESASESQRRWHQDMRGCVTQCLLLYREKNSAESSSAR